MKIDYLNLKAVNQPHIAEIERNIQQIVKSGWYLKGQATQKFEEDYAQYIGTTHCVACGNGLDALKLMLAAEIILGRLNKGDEIIVPANTYIATILAISEVGLSPVLVEPSPLTLEIDDQCIEQAITHRTKAIMIVHLYGRCAMTAHIAQTCKRHNLLLFEDNAQAHGCCVPPKELQQEGEKRENELTNGKSNTRTGSLGEAAAHSFYPGKNLGAFGDAGAVTTNDPVLAEAIRALGNYGSCKKYVFPYRGYNSRMDEIQAAVLITKLKYLDQENAKRIKVAQRYLKEINNPKIVSVPWQDDNISYLQRPEAYRFPNNVVHIFPIMSQYRDLLQEYLAQHGVQTLIHYPIPPHKQGAYKEWSHYHLPITEKLHQEELSLPCNQTMTCDQTDYIIGLINHFAP